MLQNEEARDHVFYTAMTHCKYKFCSQFSNVISQLWFFEFRSENGKFMKTRIILAEYPRQWETRIILAEYPRQWKYPESH